MAVSTMQLAGDITGYADTGGIGAGIGSCIGGTP